MKGLESGKRISLQSILHNPRLILTHDPLRYPNANQSAAGSRLVHHRPIRTTRSAYRAQFQAVGWFALGSFGTQLAFGVVGQSKETEGLAIETILYVTILALGAFVAVSQMRRGQLEVTLGILVCMLFSLVFFAMLRHLTPARPEALTPEEMLLVIDQRESAGELSRAIELLEMLRTQVKASDLESVNMITARIQNLEETRRGRLTR